MPLDIAFPQKLASIALLSNSFHNQSEGVLSLSVPLLCAFVHIVVLKCIVVVYLCVKSIIIYHCCQFES
jgi:hypothetical protein